MYKFLLLLSFCFGQSYNCLEDGIEEIVSNKLEIKNINYKQRNYNKISLYTISNKIQIVLSNEDSFIKLIGNGKKISIAQITKDRKNVFLNLENVEAV